MPGRLIIVLLFHAVFVSACACKSAQRDIGSDVVKNLKKMFPQVRAEDVNKTDIEGMYEVAAQGRVLYYFPEKEYLFTGSIWTSKGRNLTEERMGQLLTRRVQDVPLEKALKMGNGKHVVIEFTDPDCPYCRDASKFFSEQRNMTRYVFFVPLAMHKDAEQKIRYVFCAKDREKAYEEAMTGKLDGMTFAVCSDEAVEKLINEHKEIAKDIGISSTPQFWVNGRHVSGANIPLIKSLLGQGAEN